MTPISQTYTQEPHCCAPSDCEPILTIRVEDGGGGPYIVMYSTEWAMADGGEIKALADALYKMLEQADNAARKD